jgi:hypothetical protein
MASTSGTLHLLALLIRTVDNISTSDAFSGLTVQEIHSKVQFFCFFRISLTQIESQVHFLALLKGTVLQSTTSDTYPGFT